MEPNDATPAEEAEGGTPAEPEHPVATEGEVEAEANPTEDDDGEGSSTKPSKVSERINELTRNWRTTERDRDYWRDLAMQNVAKPQARQEPETEKTLEDFEFDQGAYQKYLFEQSEQRAVNAAERRLKEKDDADRRSQAIERARARTQEFAKKVKDFNEVVYRDDLPINDAMFESIVESEEGPAVAYYLGKNPEIARNISRLPPTLAAREIGRIEGRLVAEREANPPKKVSGAPPPTPKVDGSEPAIEEDPDKMPADKWLRWRQKQITNR